MGLTLYTFGQISEIEHIVRFSWSRQKFSRHSVINLHSSAHYSLSCLLHRLWEIMEESVQYRLQSNHLSVNVSNVISKYLISQYYTVLNSITERYRLSHKQDDRFSR